MKNYFLNHLPTGKWNKKFTFPLRPAMQAKFGNMSPNENFEIFNTKSCILSISERVLMFENKLIFFYFVLCFVVYNQLEIWIWIKLHFWWFVIIIFTSCTGACVESKISRYVPKIPQGRIHSYYPCHFNRYFLCQNVDRTQIAYKFA